MKRHTACRAVAVLAFTALALGAGLGGLTATAADLELRAQLIWGTDDPKPKDPQIKEAELKIKENLAKIYKWKNYFQVGEKKIEVARKDKEGKRVKLSPKCEVEVRFLDEATVEMRLFGEGKHTATVRDQVKALEKGKLSVLGGDAKDKYGDAWFVVLSLPKP